MQKKHGINGGADAINDPYALNEYREELRALERSQQGKSETQQQRSEGQTQMIMEMERKLNQGWFATRHQEHKDPCKLSTCQYWLMLRYIDVSKHSTLTILLNRTTI